MMMNRMKRAEQRTRDKIIDRAVQKARSPGSSSFGTPASSSGGTASISPAISGDFTMPDENGDTIHGFMLGVDTLGQKNAQLRVQGEPNRYYAYQPTG